VVGEHHGKLNYYLNQTVSVKESFRGFVINGENVGDYSGESVSTAGDVNGDGLDDLIVGANGADPSNKTDAGKSYVIFGKTDNTAINLFTIASGTGGFVINGENAGDEGGISVSTAGDINGDGLDDLTVGAPHADPSGKESAGKSYVIFGKTDTDAIDLANLGRNSKYAIDYLGYENANTLTGTNSDEIFVAGAGDDTLTGNGGMDALNAGAGNDTIIINADNIAALAQTVHHCWCL
jgi:Ca2+-binding RTX toxin-like protein